MSIRLKGAGRGFDLLSIQSNLSGGGKEGVSLETQQFRDILLFQLSRNSVLIEIIENKSNQKIKCSFNVSEITLSLCERTAVKENNVGKRREGWVEWTKPEGYCEAYHHLYLICRLEKLRNRE